MFLNSLSACRSRLSINVSSYHFVLLIVVFSLFGCASEPTLPIPDEGAAALPTITPQKKVYNKSYKVKGKRYSPLETATGYKARGIASWYGAESGNRTASGVRFDPHGLTAAHKTLPIPSKVRVTNLKNGRSVDVVINDRGPFTGNRLIDLSHGAAKEIDMQGLTEVSVEYLGS